MWMSDWPESLQPYLIRNAFPSQRAQNSASFSSSLLPLAIPPFDRVAPPTAVPQGAPTRPHAPVPGPLETFPAVPPLSKPAPELKPARPSAAASTSVTAKSQTAQVPAASTQATPQVTATPAPVDDAVLVTSFPAI
jgi:hypothetical protein